MIKNKKRKPRVLLMVQKSVKVGLASGWGKGTGGSYP
jgi:hypothetical protein